MPDHSPTPIPDDDSYAHEYATTIVGWLRRAVVLSTAILLAVTWKLWTPQTDFPQIPFFSWATNIGPWSDYLLLAIAAVSLIVSFIAFNSSKFWRLSLGCFIASSAMMVLLDQHRFQPWLYLALLLSLAILCLPARAAIRWSRIIVISLYFYSGISKLDVTFLETQGADILNALLAFVGHSLIEYGETTRRLLVGLLPAGELLIALCLFLPKLRRTGVVLSLLAHTALILALSPWGLNHRGGVLIWNGYFLIQNVILFWPRLQPKSSDDGAKATALPHQQSTLMAACAKLILTAALVLPMLEWFDRFDVWPAWGLYATRPAQLKIFISEAGSEQLPESMHPFLGQPRFEDGYRQLRIDRWSLAATGAPLYPANRFRLGVTQATAERYQIENDLRIEVTTSSERWTGQRRESTFDGGQAIQSLTANDWLNTRPRTLSVATTP